MDEILSSGSRISGEALTGVPNTSHDEDVREGYLRALARYVGSRPARRQPKTLDDVALELFGEPTEPREPGARAGEERADSGEGEELAPESDDASPGGASEAGLHGGVVRRFVMPDPPMREYNLRWRLPPQGGGGMGARLYARIDASAEVGGGGGLDDTPEVRLALAIAEP